MNRTFCTAALLGLMLNSHACGADTLTLAQAQRLLFNNNRDVQIAEARYLKSMLAVTEAKAAYYPGAKAYANYGYQSKPSRLHLESELTGVTPALGQALGIALEDKPIPLSLDRPIGDHDRFEIGVDISYPVFTGFSRKYAVLAQQAASTTHCLGLITVKDRLSMKLGLLYFQWELALKKVAVQKTYIEQVSEYVVQMQNLFESGVEPRARVLEASARLEAAKVDLLAAESSVDSLRLELADFLQLEDTSVVPKPYEYELSHDVIESRPRPYRPEIVVLDSTIRTINLTEKALFGKRLPTLMAMVGYRVGNPGISMGGDEITDWGIAGVQLQWEIYDGQKNWAQREQLRAEEDILKKQRKQQLALWEKTAAQKRLQIQKAHRTKAAAVLAHKAAEAFAQDLRNALTAGVVSSAEYLDALAARAQAQFRIEQAETLRKTASLQLAFALGESMEF